MKKQFCCLTTTVCRLKSNQLIVLEKKKEKTERKKEISFLLKLKLSFEKFCPMPNAFGRLSKMREVSREIELSVCVGFLIVCGRHTNQLLSEAMSFLRRSFATAVAGRVPRTRGRKASPTKASIRRMAPVPVRLRCCCSARRCIAVDLPLGGLRHSRLPAAR